MNGGDLWSVHRVTVKGDRFNDSYLVAATRALSKLPDARRPVERIQRRTVVWDVRRPLQTSAHNPPSAGVMYVVMSNR